LKLPYQRRNQYNSYGTYILPKYSVSVSTLDDSYFKWEDLEDDIIKFLELVRDTHNIEKIVIDYRAKEREWRPFNGDITIKPSDIKTGNIILFLKEDIYFKSRTYTPDSDIFIQGISFYYN